MGFLFDDFITNVRTVADQLVVDEAEVRAVVTKTRGHATKIDAKGVEGAKQKVTPAAFGSYAGADVVVSAHTKAATITAETIAKVKEALETFATDLETALETTGNADLSSKSYLEKLGGITPGDAGESTNQQAENETGFDLNDQKPSTDEGATDGTA